MNQIATAGWKRHLPLAFVLACCAFVSATVWQAGRYAQLAAESKRLAAEQEAWLEENRKLSAGISVLSSRQRADELARAMGLEKAKPQQRIGVERPGKSGAPGG